MYNEHFGFSEPPFNVTPDSRFFFVNSCYEEAFATVRYGIDARKGFIVVTGEAGTGKTTVLKRLINSLETHVHSACVFDPHLSFLELLRGLLRDLGMTPVADDDRLSMMMQLYDFLIEQLEKGHIVTLMVDEAQSMSVTMLEELRLLSNLETDTEKLIQIILVGQLGLVEKLDRPELVQLKQRVALRCQIRPLEENDVGLYIDSRLKTIRYPRRDLFDRECVKRIAHYSKGIPRLINVICDNALLIACVAGRRWVSVNDIVEAAQELQLVDISEGPVAADVGSATHTTGAEEFRPVWERPPSAIDTAPQFEPSLMDMGYRSSHFRKRRAAHTRNYAGMLVLSVLTGMLLFFAVQQKLLPLPALSAYFEHWTAFGRANGNARPVQALTPDPTDVSPEPTPLTESLNDNADSNVVAGRDGSAAPRNDRKAETPGKSSAEVAANKRAIMKSPTPVRPSGDAAVPDQRLELEIYKAIHARAILGVQVSRIDDGMVYLEGRVASPRQKLAAVRATLSVPGVKEVRNRIVID
jgi:general secretion pathway protein A